MQTTISGMTVDGEPTEVQVDMYLGYNTYMQLSNIDIDGLSCRNAQNTMHSIQTAINNTIEYVEKYGKPTDNVVKLLMDLPIFFVPTDKDASFAVRGIQYKFPVVESRLYMQRDYYGQQIPELPTSIEGLGTDNTKMGINLILHRNYTQKTTLRTYYTSFAEETFHSMYKASIIEKYKQLDMDMIKLLLQTSTVGIVNTFCSKLNTIIAKYEMMVEAMEESYL